MDNKIRSHILIIVVLNINIVEKLGDIEEAVGAQDTLLLPHDAYLRVDSYKIDHVIRNLISNAVKI